MLECTGAASRLTNDVSLHSVQHMLAMSISVLATVNDALSDESNISVVSASSQCQLNGLEP